jgi:hypothetical protein
MQAAVAPSRHCCVPSGRNPYASQLKAQLGQRQPDDALITHCLGFCTALTSHHQGEDAGMFAELLRERPELEGTVANLVEDHVMIASILSRVAEIS